MVIIKDKIRIEFNANTKRKYSIFKLLNLRWNRLYMYKFSDLKMSLLSTIQLPTPF